MFDGFSMICDDIASVCKASETYDRASDIADAMYQSSQQLYVNKGWEQQKQQALMNSIIRNNKR